MFVRKEIGMGESVRRDATLGTQSLGTQSCVGRLHSVLGRWRGREKLQLEICKAVTEIGLGAGWGRQAQQCLGVFHLKH